MNLPPTDDLKRIYGRLQDNISQKIYRHRLLYSLLGEADEISRMIYECFPYGDKLLRAGKICYYGAGEGCRYALDHYYKDVPFIIDAFKSGSFKGVPIISLDDFLNREDCRDYTVLITVGKEEAQKEIKAALDSRGLNYTFVFCDSQTNPQYFELLALQASLSDDEYFVDAGALDGETTANFFARRPGGHAYVLEPNPKQFDVVKERLKAFPNAECFPYGAYSENTTLLFDTAEGDAGAARLSNEGSVAIQVKKLDDLLKGKKVTFIKMDIEGAELAALRGAEQIIRGQRPKLAICVYHKPEDMWEIPLLILSYNPDYKFYLRHYSITETETVLYAV